MCILSVRNNTQKQQSVRYCRQLTSWILLGIWRSILLLRMYCCRITLRPPSVACLRTKRSRYGLINAVRPWFSAPIYLVMPSSFRPTLPILLVLPQSPHSRFTLGLYKIIVIETVYIFTLQYNNLN